ncbi:hypothetical protein LEP1GSC021_4148 [Leptospira noguchii str. 1993005606]|uniref:Uncharacterized protein n=1 Tax=Leptospira noguchii str. 2001034031 TaxID=1193053 RepID=M6YBE4_9LEPT|nr:hypothetical protein LEP1GSC024_4655 [Leptospira noguchii str. 2001034031]EPE81967.1 hypothetical protein LEP1GSC021_4148 [Leptospira noguchii str. 1993005606]
MGQVLSRISLKVNFELNRTVLKILFNPYFLLIVFAVVPTN